MREADGAPIVAQVSHAAEGLEMRGFPGSGRRCDSDMSVAGVYTGGRM